MKTVEPVLPECWIDTALIETLVTPITRYSHQYGCDSVAKAMQHGYTDNFALGIIDKDKRRIKYLAQFKPVKEVSSAILLWQHATQKHHYLIQICPAAEAWILQRAIESGIDLADYNLPNSLAELCAVTKTIVSQKDPRLVALFNELKRSNNPIVDTLIDWVSHLKTRKFSADLAALRS